MPIPEFQISFIMPKDTINPMAFREGLFLIRNSLRQLGYVCEIKPNTIDPEKINIILGYNLLSFNDSFKELTYIPWQLEHLPGTHWFNESSLNILKHATAVWDFSDINRELLREHGINSKLLRVGYHESMQTFEPVPDNEKDCDVLFYGAMNPRREALLDDMVKAGLEVKRITGLFGPERDEHIAKAKIVINIHYHESGIQESVRISHLLTNKVFVVSEDSRDNPFPVVDLTTAPYENLTETCLKFAKKNKLREKKRKLVFEQFKSKCLMFNYLDPLAHEVVVKMMR